MLENLLTKRENFAWKEQQIISAKDAGPWKRVLNFVGSEVKGGAIFLVLCLLFLFSVSIVIWKLAFYRFKSHK